MNRTELEQNFCRKTIRGYLEEGYYAQAGATIEILIAKNPKEARRIFLAECYAVMRAMFDGSKNPRQALNLISGVARHIPEEWNDDLKARYAQHMVDDLKIVDNREGN
ncbi:MAG: hypothetical protein MCSN_0340 [Candidatus Microsyncoccus archaeolyticus]|nr:MAG: hypothetical protein MCSN_0340 [Candidatus Parcubacteria bacterium]